MAPVFSSLYSTFSQVLPPSVERKMPRSAVRPVSVAQRRHKDDVRIARIHQYPRDVPGVFQARRSSSVFPPSVDLYTPSPYEILPRMQDSPVPT